MADSGTGQIGVLLNSTTTKGTFPTTAVYAAGSNPSSVVVDNFTNHTATTTLPATLDAIVANDTAAGSASLLTNTGTGTFGPPTTYPDGGANSASVVEGNFDGSLSVVVMNSGDSVTVLDSATGTVQATLMTDIASPVAIAVDKFGPGGIYDIAVLNSDGTVLVFANTSTTGTVSFNPTPAIAYSFGVTGASMTSGYVADNPSGLADLVVVTDDPGSNELYVLQNVSTAAGLSFSPHQISKSVFNGTPVVGQGVATGILSTKGTYAEYQDIAVAYAETGTNESMVAVFQNLDGGFQFSRTSLPGAASPDFDAGQKNPTAIAVLFLTSSATGTTTPWEDIVVTNNDNFGTVSVLQPTALPTTTTAQPTPFTDTVTIPISQESEINNLTVTVALTDQQSVQNISIVLEAPNNEGQITLVDNQNNAAGTANR